MRSAKYFRDFFMLWLIWYRLTRRHICALFIVVIAIAEISEIHASTTLQCIVAHLKANEIYEDVLDIVSDDPSNEAECESLIRIKLDEFNEKIYENMNEDENARQYIECFKHEASSDEYENLALLLQAVGMVDMGWRFWRSSSREDRLEKLRAELDEVGSKILEKCVAIEHFGKFFDEAMDRKPQLDAKGENEYCIRRYLIDRYLIDAFSYNLAINPKNVTMENFNCEEIMKGILEPAYEDLKKQESECALKILRDNNYYDHLLKLELLSKLPLTSQDKFFERQKFVDVMHSMTQQTRKCWRSMQSLPVIPHIS